jgi:hypothetical protein
MWLLTEGVDEFAVPTPGKGLTDFPENLKASMEKGLDPKYIENFFLKIEDSAKKLNNSIANGMQSTSKAIETTLFKVYENTQLYGIEFADSSTFLTQVGNSMGRLIPIQEKLITDSLIFGKAIGMSADEVGKTIGSMTKIGLSQESAYKVMENTYKTARKFGVDAKTLIGTVTGNLQKAQIYGFKGGVDGLTKMAVQAQKIGISIELAQKTAEKILEGGPEAAIEMAAEMQMLGGSVGALADPFQLLNMAQNDIGGIQDALVNASAKAVDFNEKTGDFKIPAAEAQRMRLQAKALGLTYQELADASIKQRREQEIMSRIPLSAGYSDEQKALISSMAELKDGKVMVQLPGMEGMVEASKLTDKQLGELKKVQEVDKLSMEDVAKQQLSTQSNMALSLSNIEKVGVFGMGIEKGRKIPEIGKELTYAGDKKPYEDLLKTSKTTFEDQGDGVINMYRGAVDLTGNMFTTFTNELSKLVEKLAKFEFGKVKPENTEGKTTPMGLNTTPVKTEGKTTPMGKEVGKTAFNSVKSIETTLPKSIEGVELSKVETIAKNIQTTSTNNENVTISGGFNVTLDINSNIPSNLLPSVIDSSDLKDKITTIASSKIEERLSKNWSRKIGNYG